MLTIFYSPRCLDYHAPGHPESPQRIRNAVSALKRHAFEWREPVPCSEEDILRVHTRSHLNAVKRGSFFDFDTPALDGIYNHAILAAGAAIQAAELALGGTPSFSLMRPPGHHATRDRAMGFCYFNNIAVAVANFLAKKVQLSTTNPRRVAIFDFDCHHGNGTEDIFRGNESVLFISLHQSPCYPGTGLQSGGNIVNHPLPPRTAETEYLHVVDKAFEKIRSFKPHLLALSAGFDAYRGDPITQMGLEIGTFGKIGARIAALGLPAFAVLEGGYSSEFGECVEAFALGWSGRL